MSDVRAKQVIFSAVPFILEVKPGEHLDSWLVHPTTPMAQRALCPRPSIQTYSMIHEHELLEDELFDEARERIYSNWDERKDLAMLLGENGWDAKGFGFSRLDWLNIFSSEPGDNAPFLASLVFESGDGGRRFVAMDSIAANRIRKNQIIVKIPGGIELFRGETLRVISGIPNPMSVPVSVSVLLKLARPSTAHLPYGTT